MSSKKILADMKELREILAGVLDGLSSFAEKITSMEASETEEGSSLSVCPLCNVQHEVEIEYQVRCCNSLIFGRSIEELRENLDGHVKKDLERKRKRDELEAKKASVLEKAGPCPMCGSSPLLDGVRGVKCSSCYFSINSPSVEKSIAMWNFVREEKK